jgi:hypothetical protein
VRHEDSHVAGGRRVVGVDLPDELLYVGLDGIGDCGGVYGGRRGRLLLARCERKRAQRAGRSN